MNKNIKTVLALIIAVTVMFSMCITIMDTQAAPRPSKPSIWLSSGDYTHITVHWGKAKNAQKYYVYMGTKKGKKIKYKKVRSTSALSYTRGVSYGKTYYFKVKSVRGSKKSGYSKTRSGMSVLGRVTTVHANATCNKVTLTYNRVAGANQYRIFRNGVRIGTSYGASFTDTSVQKEEAYTYSVQPERYGKVSGGASASAKTNHKWVVENTVSPTCSAKGCDHVVCENCGTENDINVIPATDHEWRLATTAEKQEEVTIYRCTCGFKSFAKEDMDAHIEDSKDYTSATTQVKPYKCNSCGSTFDTAKQAELHTLLNIYEPGDFVNYIEETGKFKCNICGEEYSSQETCVAHMESAHAPCPNGATRVEQLQSTTLTTYTCENCGFTSNTLEEMNAHLDAQGHRHSYRTTKDAWIAPHWVCEDCGKRSMQEQHAHNWVQKYDTITHTEDIKIYGFEFCPKCGYCYYECGYWDEATKTSVYGKGKRVFLKQDENHWAHGEECGVSNWLNYSEYLGTRKITWTEKTNLHYECETCGKTK